MKCGRFPNPRIGTIATPSARRSRPRRNASASTARRSLVPSTSTTPRSCMRASEHVAELLEPVYGVAVLGHCGEQLEAVLLVACDERQFNLGLVDGNVHALAVVLN